MALQSQHAIGIFDSGIGGLTVARSVVSVLPHENLVYFGDTAHLPYGDKSATALQNYSVKIAEMLLQQPCKAILIACYSASSAAFDVVKEFIGDRALIFNVIDPVIDYLGKHYSGKRLGLIGTRQTINSNVYLQKILDKKFNLQLTQQSTPILASAIEEQFVNQKILDEILFEYLSQPTLQNIDGLILGCTHYPVVKDKISQFYKHKVEVIDTSDIIAKALQKTLKEHKLLNEAGVGQKKFYVSDYTDSFAKGAKLFFSENISLEHFPLWD